MNNIMLNTQDIKNLLVHKYKLCDFRINNQLVKTVELQGIQFEANKDYIIREPNYDYANREIQWYKSQSLNVNDIPGGAPTIWKQCADVNGDINSNYGWMIFSKENGSQYNNCLWQLTNDFATREAVMIYNRPSMHVDATSNHKHDFCCTFSTQCFLNRHVIQTSEHIDNTTHYIDKTIYSLKYIVYQRSCDAVFGYNNDILWHRYVYDMLINDLTKHYNTTIQKEPIIYNCGSLHVYERHFKFLQ